jgi:transcriptional regulator with XRE-family HTH domain
VPSARNGKSGLSQEEFAERANVHRRTYISSVELGKVNVGIGIPN